MSYADSAIIAIVVLSFIGMVITKKIGEYEGYKQGCDECRTYYIGDDSGEKEEGRK